MACALLERMRMAGMRAAGYKPVASGAEATAEGLRNEDALALMRDSAPGLRYDQVNTYCFAPPVAPHLAAREAGVAIERGRLDAAHAALAQSHQQVVVEGAGGWLVPLGEDCTFADWVASHRWPVLLVVGMRLGCINHALLSVEAIQRKTALLGWVANVLPPAQDRLQENLETLQRWMPVPCLGVVPAQASLTQAAAALDWARLLQLLRE